MSSTHRRFSWSAPDLRSPFHIVILACLVTLSSYLAAMLGGSLALVPQRVWPLWPGCGLLVAVLLLVPRRIRPVLVAAGLSGFIVYDLQNGLALHSTLLLIVADTTEILIATVGVSYFFDGVPRLNSVKSLVRYSFFSVMLAPLASAFISSIAFGANYWIRLRIGFFTEALALLTLTPAILSWLSPKQGWLHKSRAFYFEAAALVAALSVLGYIAFLGSGPTTAPVAIYSLLPLLLWAALRFGSMGISTSMVVVAFLSIWGAVHGRGPFTGSEPLQNVMALQLFLFFAATTFTVLAVLGEERKETERAFRESEKRFRLMADTAPVLIWMSDTDKLCSYFNKPWLEFTGRSLDLELGHGWAEGIHPDDLRMCMETYAQAFDRRQEFRMEYRLRRHDGEYRWIIDIGVPRFDQQRSFIGYIGTGIDVTERKQAEQALRESEGRFHLAAQAGKMYAYEWDVATDKVTRSEEHVNVLGFGDLGMKVTRQQVLAGVHVDDRELFASAIDQPTPDRPTTRISYRLVRADGSAIWLEKSARVFFDDQGKMLRVIGMVADITERKRAEEALRESEERFRLAAQAGKMFAYEWDAATDIVARSAESAPILGIPETEQLTGEQLLNRVHPDDRERLEGAVVALSPEKPYLQISYRMLRPDGSEVWLERTSRAHFDEEGRIVRLVGMVADISERKRVDEALSSMSRRLIEAQEQERARIARELHDDIGQRLALLAVELEQLREDSLDVPAEIRRRVGELLTNTSGIAVDVQSLSHTLHSAKLQYLGIAAAMKAFCKEFGDQQNMEIDFRTHDLPNPLSSEISLCLFRVLQEGVHNSAKHSGVRHVEVRVWGTSDEIHLEVSDSGAGFDHDAAKRGRGLGLISMEERLKLVKGIFSIESQPKRGTKIHARVPLTPGSDSMRAAG